MSKFLQEDSCREREADTAFFKEAMRDVRRGYSVQRAKEQRPFSSNAVPIKVGLKESNELPSCVILMDPFEYDIGPEDRLYFSQQGLPSKRGKALRQGKISLLAHLDLHRMTVEQARHSVLYFLTDNRKKGNRCVRIIHGKGYLSSPAAKLKNHVNAWLRQIPWILAFSSATLRDGGTGAVYVLLKRIHLLS